MSKLKEFLKVIVIAAFGFGAILLALVGLAASGLLDTWMASTAPEQLTANVVGRVVKLWLFSLPFALAALMMTESRLKDLCLWAPLYAPIAALIGIILARL